MKLRYIFAVAAAGILTLAGCNEKYEVDNLKGLTVSSSYVSIPSDGGSNKITIQANDTWQLDTTGTQTGATPWLTFSALTGQAGESELTISADASLDGRTAEVRLVSGGQTQRINIIQGLTTITTATCAEVIAGPESKTYRVTGTCTAIANTNYGNFYLDDGTGSIYIYGTVNASGSYAWSSFNIDVGDEVTVQGPKSVYNGTVELVDAQFISVNKSLIKVDSTYVGGENSSVLPIEGGDIDVYYTLKGGDGVHASIPDDAQSWLSIKSVDGNKVTYHAAANTGGDRSTTITLSTTQNSREYTSQVEISQKGAIVAATLAEFKAAEVGQTQYRLNVLVTRLDNRGNYYVNDYSDPSGEIEIYKPTGDLASSVKAGDVITVVGTRAQYRSTIEMANPTVEAVNPATSVSLADFNAAEDGSALLMITGTVKQIRNDKYGNIYVTDGTNDVYVYGVYGYGAPRGADRQNFLATNSIEVGDQITLVGPKSTYNGTIEMNGGYYVSHTKATTAAKHRK